MCVCVRIFVLIVVFVFVLMPRVAQAGESFMKGVAMISTSSTSNKTQKADRNRPIPQLPPGDPPDVVCALPSLHSFPKSSHFNPILHCGTNKDKIEIEAESGRCLDMWCVHSLP